MKKATKKLKLKMTLFFILFSIVLNAQVGIGTTAPTAQLTVMEDGIFNESGGNHNFRVETNNKANMFYIDGANDRVYINSATGSNGDIFSVYNTTTHNGTVPWLINSYNSYNTGGSGFFQNLSTTNGYNALEGITNYAGTSGVVSGIFGLAISTNTNQIGIGVRGVSNNSDGIGVRGSIPTIGSWFGFGGYFSGGLGYANGLYNVSDARTKREIIELDDALNKLIHIQGYQYKYDFEKHNSNTKNNDQIHYGFMAQNVKEHLPHAVAEKNVIFENDIKNERGNNENKDVLKLMNVVDYTAIIPVTVEAIKEQQEIIENQNYRITNLEEKILLLESKLNALIED